VYREEGFTGFFRGLWIPLVTISFVRAYMSFPKSIFVY
jgi:solute carrier family 25 carnitine/acylcarnitine transporter 20/29